MWWSQIDVDQVITVGYFSVAPHTKSVRKSKLNGFTKKYMNCASLRAYA